MVSSRFCVGGVNSHLSSVFPDGLMLSSHERKYVGFQLCGFLLPSLAADEVGVVFSPNLLGCLTNNSCAAGNYLHSAAKHLVSCRHAACVKSDILVCVCVCVLCLELGELCTCVETTTDQNLLASLFLHLQCK